MISSMTGFGRGEVVRDGYRAVFEVSSVNSRFMEVSLRLPRWLLSLEPPLKAIVDQRLSRGKAFCQLTLARDDSAAPDVSINDALAGWYVTTLRELAVRYNLDGELRVGDLVRLPDLWSGKAQTADETVEEILREALTSAVDGLVATRDAEGQALCADLRERLAIIARVVASIKVETASVPAAIREKLTARVEELFGSAEYDPQRLAQEIAYMAERADVTEECVRLTIHREQFEEALDAERAVGRRLNFLLQEMNREANTIGSKSATAEVSTMVVTLKEELERIREQVQNIE